VAWSSSASKTRLHRHRSDATPAGKQNNRRIEQERELEQQLRIQSLKRPPEPFAVDVVGELHDAMDSLEKSAQTFEDMHGKINQPLVDSRLEVERLRRELAEAESRLKTLEEKGDSIAQLRAAIMSSESRYLGLHGAAAKEIVQSLIDGRLGPGVPFERIPSHLKDEVRLNSRVRGLDSLRLSHSFGPKGNVSKDELLKALDRLGNKFVALRDYVIEDREKHASK
jgi:hypothetical protein